MGRIVTTQRLILEDFPDQKDWIGKLFDPLNEFITRVLATANGGVVFAENITGVDRELDFNFVSAAVSFPQVFQWPLGVKPLAMVVVSAYENDPASNRNFAPVIVSLAWQLNSQNQIEITDAVKLDSSPAVASLTVARRYKIRVRVTP